MAARFGSAAAPAAALTQMAGRADKPQPGVGGLCLDFLATGPAHADPEDDQLGTPDHLGRWLEAYGLPTPAGGLTEEDLHAARALRRAIDGVARAVLARRPVAAGDLRTVNAAAQRHTPVFLLRPTGQQRTVVEEVDAAGSFSVIARDAIHVLAEQDPARLRECSRPGCSTLFYDRSPAGRRRWCAMKGCGEIVASATYRQRRAARAAQ